MKKIITKIALISALASSAQAGAILDLEVGGGMWSTNAPTGSLDVGIVSFDLSTEANLGSTSDNTYMWAVIDHPIPVVPNLRIEQSTLVSSGTKTIDIAGLITGDINTELDMSHTDFIAYWGIPFSTWLPFIDEFDVGLGTKVFSGSLSMVDSLGVATPVAESFSGAALPYLYTKLRVQPPLLMGVGFEAELKYLSIDVGSIVSNFTETIVKADWGFEAPLPILDIEAGVELGYRIMSIDIDASDLTTNMEFNGIFFGVYGKFGI